MHRFKNIGVVLNLERSNSDALARTKELANINQANIHFLCVVPHDIRADQKYKVESFLQDSVDFDFSLNYITRKPVVEITRYSADNKLDMILIEPESDNNILNRFFHGALTLSLMRKTPCAIWVVKKPVSTTYQRIMIAVNPRDEEGNYVESSLNEKLIQIGTSYAKRQSAECHLVTAWNLDSESILEGPFINATTEEIEKLKSEEIVKCAQAFEQLQKHHQDIISECQTHIVRGYPGSAIPKFAKDNSIDLIVMGTLARSAIQGYLIGNTAESIINQVDCSIIAIKPDDFISPILL